MGRKTPAEIACYQRRTREVLSGGSRAHETKQGRDWIGNRWETGASKINNMLIDGATWEHLSKARGAVQNHLDCLTKDLGLPVVRQNGIYTFDRDALGGDARTSNRTVPSAGPTSSVSVITAPQCAVSTDRAVAKNRLVTVVSALAAEKRAELERLKEGQSGLARPDFLWHYLLQSFATMGRASGWRGLIGNKDNYRHVSYSALAALAPEGREKQVREICRRAGIRMPDRKANFILRCFNYVTRLGGPEVAKAKLLAQPGRDAKIAFLQTFPGIGPKYARNIMMDVYHEDFRDSIAIDVRIKAISQALGLNFASYLEHEAFYLDVARDAGLNGWELDRLLFNFRPEIESRLGVDG